MPIVYKHTIWQLYVIYYDRNMIQDTSSHSDQVKKFQYYQVPFPLLSDNRK